MNWLFVFVVLILTAGFAKLCVVSLNWWFAHRLSTPVITASHLLNLLLIVTYPIVLVANPVSNELRGFVAGHSSPLSMPLILMIIAGLVGLVLLIWSAIEFQTHAAPRCQISCESTVIDLKRQHGASWKSTFLGPGPMRRIAQLPGNQQFSLLINTKTFSLPRLPSEWDGLSIVHLSDMHFRGAVDRAYFEMVCEHAASLKPDLFVFTGDLFDDLRLVDWLSSTLGKLTAPLGQFFILGNHDWHLNNSVIRNELLQFGWCDVAGRGVVLGEKSSSPLVLCGDETPWMGAHPNPHDFPAKAFRILLSHTPDNIFWARQQKFDLMLSGHTHGGQIRVPILGPIYSPSRYGCRYSAGVFWLAPTLLHVSQGISGREPVRYNCPPELIKLVHKCESSSVASRS